MGKQYQTFPGEQQEMPQPGPNPEIEQPADLKEPEIPREDEQVIPDVYPPEESSPGAPVITPS